MYTQNGDDTFKPIPGFEGLYEVNAAGRVRSIRRGKLVALQETEEGYLSAALWKNDKTFLHRVHRLVMAAHRPDEYREDLTVDHVDRDRTNNHVDNLRMATHCEQRENQSRPLASRQKGVTVARTLADGTTITYSSVAEAARMCGIPIGRIERALKKPSSEWQYEHVVNPQPDLPAEEWKSVGEIGIEVGRSEAHVSSHGRVRRRLGGSDWRPAFGTDEMTLSNGYPKISINKKPFMVHILVAKLFLPRPSDPARCIVNHKDGDKLNAAASNLEWVTRSENARHAHATGLYGARKRKRSVPDVSDR